MIQIIRIICICVYKYFCIAFLNSSMASVSPSSTAWVIQCEICSLMISFPRPFNADLLAAIYISTAAQSSSLSIIFFMYSKWPITRERRLICLRFSFGSWTWLWICSCPWCSEYSILHRTSPYSSTSTIQDTQVRKRQTSPRILSSCTSSDSSWLQCVFLSELS